MNAVILQHEENEGLGLLEPALRDAGFTLTRRFRGPRHEDVNAALVVVLGGHMGVYASDLHPFLRDEVALLSERLAADRPCLGICLGAQLMAAASGAEVSPGKNGFEVGAGKVRWTKDALADTVLVGARPRADLMVAHWHGDTFKPVPGATLLASTDRYVQQGFRLGRSYGFQFHLELTAQVLGRWLEDDAEALQARGVDLEAAKAGLGKLQGGEPALRGLADRLVHHFSRAARVNDVRG